MPVRLEEWTQDTLQEQQVVRRRAVGAHLRNVTMSLNFGGSYNHNNVIQWNPFTWTP